MLKVIGAGLGRTGTASMKAALEHLGFGPTYHMFEIIADPGRMLGWVDVMKGGTPDWEGIFDGFQSTLDWPAAAYWRELSEAYPTAKVLLTVRDPERWYRSVYDTIYQGVKSGEAPTEGGHEFWGLLQERGPGPWFEDRERALRFFEEHNAAVREAVPAERLLVHHVGDGWAPLCEFLDVPVPDKDFPHLNETAEIGRLIERARSGQTFESPL